MFFSSINSLFPATTWFRFILLSSWVNIDIASAIFYCNFTGLPPLTNRTSQHDESSYKHTMLKLISHVSSFYTRTKDVVLVSNHSLLPVVVDGRDWWVSRLTFCREGLTTDFYGNFYAKKAISKTLKCIFDLVRCKYFSHYPRVNISSAIHIIFTASRNVRIVGFFHAMVRTCFMMTIYVYVHSSTLAVVL